jgi:hypothetical protein
MSWFRRQPAPVSDPSLIGTIQRIEADLSKHTAAFREYVLATDIRLEIIDVLATKVLPQIARALHDGAEANRVLADSQAKLNETFERVLAALPSQPAPHPTENHVPFRPVQERR